MRHPVHGDLAVDVRREADLGDVIDGDTTTMVAQLLPDRNGLEVLDLETARLVRDWADLLVVVEAMAWRGNTAVAIDGHSAPLPKPCGDDTTPHAPSARIFAGCGNEPSSMPFSSRV